MLIIMLKILWARLQQYENRELPDVQAGFRNGRGTRDQIANIRWIIEKQESSRKTCTSALLTMPKPLTVWITTNCGKFFKRWEYQATFSASWEICMQVRKQQLELDLERQTGSKLGKEYVKAVYCHPAYLTYMQSISEKCWTGWSTSWNHKIPDHKHKIAGWNINNLWYADDTTLMAESKEELKTSWWKWKRRVRKAGLKLNI